MSPQTLATRGNIGGSRKMAMPVLLSILVLALYISRSSAYMAAWETDSCDTPDYVMERSSWRYIPLKTHTPCCLMWRIWPNTGWRNCYLHSPKCTELYNRLGSLGCQRDTGIENADIVWWKKGPVNINIGRDLWADGNIFGKSGLFGMKGHDGR